ncbi:unnamed protein product [Acanthoscelides obtectus]|uniref:Uncharacterized protein n=1 Tax=Acanthoscelides obtectus TaxID=200917 RepID=A0A9P0M7W4_ACAOB|nr:unnamed protein product [Acanthoscelides obtectus]CAK1622517.1 hypothetical protein AOBTE_LOCUS1535 [Acanthoscelides obtectus]
MKRSILSIISLCAFKWGTSSRSGDMLVFRFCPRPRSFSNINKYCYEITICSCC